jgi:hypothetical protein
MSVTMAVPEVAYFKTDYVTKMKWHDGQYAFCKRCDSDQPLTLVNVEKSTLACPEGHPTHALNVVLARSED